LYAALPTKGSKMSRTNTAHSYGTVAKTFHWLTAFLIITLIVLGVVANGMAYDTSEQLAMKAWMFSMHKTLGVTMFFVALARIAWALTQPKPNGLHPDRKAENWLAETVHWLLYSSLILVPLTGWIHHAATTGFAPIWWPFGQGLPFVGKDEGTAALFGGLHVTFEKVLLLAIFLHVAGAVKHHVIDKDATLRRMWFGESNAPETHGGHSTALPIASALIAWAAAVGIGSATGMFAHTEAKETAALEQVSSEWSVQSGEIAITIDQFGGTVQGNFSDWTAAIAFDPETGLGTTEVTIATGSLTLGSVTSQATGPDFFEVEQFPTATFTADITPLEGAYVATGTLTIRDQSMPLTLPFDLSITDKTATMKASTTLNRLDFDIGKSMADESNLKFGVNVDISLTATQD
jgi:cytochrome b561/polyisoprenoid-binding protein YceI